MLQPKPIPEGKQCAHVTCRDVCHRIYKEKKQHQLKRTPLKRSQKPIAKASVKEKAKRASNIGSNEIWRWFLERRTEMKGVCAHCLGKSSKNSDDYFHFSIAHILPKKLFPSVATHKDNWIELCSFGKNCHGNYDNYMIDIIELNCYDTVIERFISMYPSIDQKEKRRIPAALMNYIDIP